MQGKDSIELTSRSNFAHDYGEERLPQDEENTLTRTGVLHHKRLMGLVIVTVLIIGTVCAVYFAEGSSVPKDYQDLGEGIVHEGKTLETGVRSCNFQPYEDWLQAPVTKSDGEKYSIVDRITHDPSSFTQGLSYANGVLYESTGLYKKSKVRILDPLSPSGKVLNSVDMDPALFGEGMTYWRGKLVQITWKSRQGFIYDATTLEPIHPFEFSTTKNEGWGITWDWCKDEFIVTDGSPFLHFWDPATLQEKRKVQVYRMDGKPAEELNEIEYWRGRLLANVWFEDVLLVIDPETGKVEKEYDFSTLWPKSERRKQGADVFNGISISDDDDILYVTGKKWNRIYSVKLEV